VPRCILAIDQGTTNSKALLIDEAGAVRATAAVPVPVAYPRPGWVEQAPNDLWSTATEAARAVLDRTGGTVEIAAIGISNQRESVLLWNRTTGEPVGPCITWQCRRSAGRIERLRSAATEAMVSAKTGLGLDPLFPAAKIGWLLEEYPAARRLADAGQLCAGTVDSWLMFNLTGGTVHATDFSNAARTQLFNIIEGVWDDELCALFGVPRSILPAALGSDALFGVTSGAGGLPAGIPIHAAVGDSHAALFGHAVRAPGEVKATYGTGSSLMSLTAIPRVSRHGLSTTIAWRRNGRTTYALEGNISVSVQAAAWMAAFLGLPDVVALTSFAETSRDAGVVVVPAFAGLGAPHWDPEARAAIVGLSLASTRADAARATLEAIALQIRDVFGAMESDLGHRLDRLAVDGGPTRNETLMQLQADLLDRPVRPHQLSELSAAGAGVMAGVACGLWSEAEGLAIVSSRDRTFEPAMSSDRRVAILARWQAALRSVRELSSSRDHAEDTGFADATG
jgi:glycerol kinase